MIRPESIASAAPTAHRSTCRVIFGAGATRIEPATSPTLSIALPVLGGPTEETLLTRAGSIRAITDGVLCESEGEAAGLLVAPAGAELEAAARDLYRRVFAETRGRRLYRIWNYVPQINAVTGDLENYRRFCRGRSLAFEDEFGIGYRSQLPAASAVGVAQGPLAVAFRAGDEEPRHFENPSQIPAFEYPAIYGPRAPSFSRATLAVARGIQELFVSGTAAIRGHATVAANDLTAQLACTRENLALIAATAGAGTAFGATDGWRRSFKVYVRHAADFRAVQADLRRHLLQANDTVTYLEADLCRADLLVEIEAVLTK